MVFIIHCLLTDARIPYELQINCYQMRDISSSICQISFFAVARTMLVLLECLKGEFLDFLQFLTRTYTLKIGYSLMLFFQIGLRQPFAFIKERCSLSDDLYVPF